MIQIAVYIAILVLAFLVGVLVRPAISKFIKKNSMFDWFNHKMNRYEIEFKIEFYSQPSIHHLGEQGMLVKTDPIKLQVDAETQDEALDIVALIVKQETKSELVSIKEIPKI